MERDPVDLLEDEPVCVWRFRFLLIEFYVTPKDYLLLVCRRPVIAMR